VAFRAQEVSAIANASSQDYSADFSSTVHYEGGHSDIQLDFLTLFLYREQKAIETGVARETSTLLPDSNHFTLTPDTRGPDLSLSSPSILITPDFP